MKKCDCESLFCLAHNYPCPNPAGKTKTIYGTHLCDACAERMPAKYIRRLPKIFGHRETEYGRRVDVQLHDTNTTTDVFWSAHKNSYVLASITDDNSWKSNPEAMERFYFQRGEEWFTLVSINGAGEVRWSVSKDRLEQAEEAEEENPEKCVDGAPGAWDMAEYLAAARHFNLIPR